MDAVWLVTNIGSLIIGIGVGVEIAERILLKKIKHDGVLIIGNRRIMGHIERRRTDVWEKEETK